MKPNEENILGRLLTDRVFYQNLEATFQREKDYAISAEATIISYTLSRLITIFQDRIDRPKT
jgi:hypothetical protein